MTYQQAVEYLYNSTPVFEHVGATAYKEGLSNTIALDNHFGNPHRKFKSIHVAGTNGKGSCSHTLASILQEAGFRVGLYTSPHLVDFRERIRINGMPIPETEVVEFIEKERSFFEPLHPSFFELTTAMAFKYFADQKIDIAVVEVGLGGRLDCTNIITPILSVITNISFDHVQFLGNTLAEIAREKAGIIKYNVPVVIGETTDTTREVFESVASEANSPIVFSEDVRPVKAFELVSNGMKYETSYGNIESPLGGLYQQHNMNTILTAVSVLQKLLPDAQLLDNLAQGVKGVVENTGLLGRWQKLREEPLVYCDTGHNVGGWNYLSRQLSMQKCETLRIIFGMVDDKDINSVLALLPSSAIIYFTNFQSKRAVGAQYLSEIGTKLGLHCQCYDSVVEAYDAALCDSKPTDFIFVGGSTYVVADLMANINF